MPSLRPGLRAMLCLVLLAAIGHRFLLGDWLLGVEGGRPRVPSPGLTLVRPRPAAMPVGAEALSAIAADADATATATATPAPRHGVAQLPAEPPEQGGVVVAAAGPTRGDAAEDPSPPAAEASAVGAAPVDAAPSAAMELPGTGADAPLHRVALPPSFVAAYEFKRGALGGTAELSWSSDGGRYAMRLQARLGGVAVLAQSSEGRVEPTGLEPGRFVVTRMGRNARAVNFQGDKGLITFSGPGHRYAWRQGTQDRLSWLVQLPAILAAESPRLAEGQRFAMVVVGAGGEADAWTFTLMGWETVTTPTGDVRCARLLRQAGHAHDQQVEVWLDTQRHYLPVRARIGGPDDPRSFELSRQ